ncbi:hypothetical protein A0J61_09902 [Choanephora cucurbitarum]|uniref:Uncharacterized protein n=1 Tax=Choanephora cucurbitarum TaxID=101091 RepID=A0A1C7MZ64_9FUNG|nr:hypothetical protein A0J61_09902 [Choanephora cucurbitarum]
MYKNGDRLSILKQPQKIGRTSKRKKPGIEPSIVYGFNHKTKAKKAPHVRNRHGRTSLDAVNLTCQNLAVDRIEFETNFWLVLFAITCLAYMVATYICQSRTGKLTAERGEPNTMGIECT